MKKALLYILCLTILFSCKNENPTASDGVNSTIKTESEIPKSRTLNKGDYRLDIEYSNQDKTSLQFRHKGKKLENLDVEGIVISSFFTDLDSDKNDELFLEVRNQKNEKNLVGFVLNAGSLLPITISHPTRKPDYKSKSFSTSRSQIVESVEYTDKNNKNKTKQVRYNLISRETNYVLKPEGKNSSDLDRLIGQYASKDYNSAGYYSTLNISKNDFEEWVVNIKMKDIETRTTICDFLSVGDFVEGDLFVPLNYQKENLKGNLQIRFIDFNAIVYTEDPADVNETTRFCNGTGSIIGTFKKTDI